MKKILLVVAFVVSLFAVPVFAQIEDAQFIKSKFKNYLEIETLNNSIIMPVAVDVTKYPSNLNLYGVYNVIDGVFESSRIDISPYEIPLYVTSSAFNPTIENLIDKKLTTYTDFSVTNRGGVTSDIIITTAEPVESARINFQMAKNVTFPEEVIVYAKVNNVMQVVYNNDNFIASGALQLYSPSNNQANVGFLDFQFPSVKSDYWQISFKHINPLRFSELILFQKNDPTKDSARLKFSALPGKKYYIYYDSEVLLNLPQSVSYQDVVGVEATPLRVVSSNQNSEFAGLDTDKDGVKDAFDNCKNIPNADQIDKNLNKIGDACEDDDSDNIMNNKDNCEKVFNPDQKDEDSDGIGDKCDKEESRITEKYAWIPWVGIGSAIISLIALFALTARKGQQ